MLLDSPAYFEQVMMGTHQSRETYEGEGKAEQAAHHVSFEMDCRGVFLKSDCTMSGLKTNGAYIREYGIVAAVR